MKSLIIIPALNEKENILEIVPEIFNVSKKFHILIVDDNSSDGTDKAADFLAKKYPKNVFVLHRREKPGLSRVYIEGFKWALEKDYDVIFEMDADGSHSPKYLPDFLAKIKECDLVVGCRYYQGRISVVNWDMKRLFLSLIANLYARIITHVPVSDATTGFKCFRRKILETVNLDKILSEGYSFQIEMNWRAHKAGFKIGQIPIIFYERRHGTSKLSTNIIREGLWILLRMRLR